MTPSNAGIFKARKFGSLQGDFSLENHGALADSTTDYVSLTNANQGQHYGATELTKNDKYCVSRLPALPPMLSNDRMDESPADFYNGYTDHATKCALVVSQSAINVWPYISTDETPITFEFPLNDTAGGALQLAILTRPPPGSALDPGVAIINSVSGHVCFYESVQYAPALGMIHSKSIETHVDIAASQGEYITLAENVEPAGIAVATSWKRVVLVLLRDYKGAPCLRTLELTKPPATTRLLGGWWGGGLGDEIPDEIVLIKSGAVSQHGTSQEILVQDAGGTFKKYVHVLAASGLPFVHHRKGLLYRLSSYLEKNIDGLIPGSVVKTRFLDLWPLVQDAERLDDVYVSLVAVETSLGGEEAQRLLLLKLQINESGVLVLSLHQLPSPETLGATQADARPRLYLPKPGNTAFVAIGNSVVLSDLNPVSSAPKSSDFAYYEPKWEDVVSFKSSVHIVGYGYEDKTTASENPALVFITSEHGVVRIERFADTSTDITTKDSDPADPVALLKSHIEQAIFYGGSSLVEFSLSTPATLNIIRPAVNAVVGEIMDSTSPYLPPNFASTRDSFALRIRLLSTLIEYARANFSDSVYVVFPVIVEALEKLEVASKLWNFVDSAANADAAKIKAMLKLVIKANHLENKVVSHDTIRSFFNYNVGEILTVLTYLVDDMSASDVPISLLVQLLVSTLHDAVHKTEITYIFGISEIPPFKLWIFDSNLLVKAEETFTQAFCMKHEGFQSLDSAARRNELIKFTETLYFLVTSAIHYMQQTNDDQLHEYLQWYNTRKGAWVDALISHGLPKEALAIAQKYHDFFSVAHVLDKEREQTSPEYVFDKMDFFMNQYGYDFAVKLFDYYIMQGDFQRILVDCKPYAQFLERYFEENPEKSKPVSWMYYLQARDFEQASGVLMSLSTDERSENQENKELNYSLAKLSAIAAKVESAASIGDTSKFDEIAVEAENSLVAVRVQNKLHKTISSFVEDKTELMTLDFFMDNLSNPQLESADVLSTIEPFFARFVEQKSLTKQQLVSLLTAINPTARFEYIFADALKVAALIDNDSVFHDQASEIWKTLLCATDDWRRITATEENSDEVNKMRVRDTVMFKTLKGVQDNKEIMGVLDDVLLQARKEDGMGDGSQWDGRLAELSRDCNLAMWVDTVRNEAR